MLDLASFVSQKTHKAHFDESQTWTFATTEALAFAGSKKKPAVSSAPEEDLDKQVVIGHTKTDHWIHIPGRNVLIRVHVVPRKAMYIPIKKTCPVPVEHLTPERITEADFENEETVVHNDNWKTKAVAPFEKLWTGRTKFVISWITVL